MGRSVLFGVFNVELSLVALVSGLYKCLKGERDCRKAFDISSVTSLEADSTFCKEFFDEDMELGQLLDSLFLKYMAFFESKIRNNG